MTQHYSNVSSGKFRVTEVTSPPPKAIARGEDLTIGLTFDNRTDSEWGSWFLTTIDGQITSTSTAVSPAPDVPPKAVTEIERTIPGLEYPDDLSSYEGIDALGGVEVSGISWEAIVETAGGLNSVTVEEDFVTPTTVDTALAFGEVGGDGFETVLRWRMVVLDPGQSTAGESPELYDPEKVSIDTCDLGDIELRPGEVADAKVGVKNRNPAEAQVTVEITADILGGGVTWTGIGFVPSWSSGTTVPVTIDPSSAPDVLTGNTVSLSADVVDVSR